MPEQLSQGSATEAQAAIAAYEQSRERFIRTVTSETEKRFVESVAKRREVLNEEVQNLAALAKVRYATRQQTLKGYAEKAPGRVTPSGLLPPLPGLGFGVEKLYKSALKAADEFNEVNNILKKKREMLDGIDGELRQKLRDYHTELIRQLETPDGLASAFRLDPLLERAHARMIAATGRKPETAARE